jgi:Glycosyltransferase family 9 (heptosyltransferase)
MGIGDDIIATGIAKGAAKRGKRIAFGDGSRIKWGPYSAMVFKNNPNVAPPGSERSSDIEWNKYCKGNRIYNKQSTDRWIWNYEFGVQPGEFYFDDIEDVHNADSDLILIEPNVPKKPCGPNKQWPLERWDRVSKELILSGFKVRQFEYGAPNHIAPRTLTPTFRHAAALLKSARMAILPEGGLHHAAAAVGVPAIVLFGGFVPPAVLGYNGHINLTGGATACGSFNRCPHCIAAMDAIQVKDVLDAAERLLQCR